MGKTAPLIGIWTLLRKRLVSKRKGKEKWGKTQGTALSCTTQLDGVTTVLRLYHRCSVLLIFRKMSYTSNQVVISYITPEDR